MIGRVAGCTADEFAARYTAPRMPVIVTDATDGWLARTLWTPANLAARFGDRKVEVRRAGKWYRTRLESYVKYLDGQARRTGGAPREDILYLHALVLNDVLPELLSEFAVSPLFRPNWMELWPLRTLLPSAIRSSLVMFVGPAGAGSATHRDRYHTHAWLTQIFGEKQFWMVAPEHHAACYEDARDRDRSVIADLESFDPSVYPQLDPTRVETCMLRPGETLFIPAGWWHAARSVGTSISLSENYVNRTNFRDFRRDLPVAVMPPRFPRAGWMNRLVSDAFLRLHGLRCAWLREGNA